jgi:hypothetical protein
VLIAAGVDDTVGVTVGAGEKDEHAERMNVNRNSTRTDRVNLFCMDCILLNYNKFCA